MAHLRRWLKKHIEAIVIQEVTLFISNAKVIADAVTKQRLPAVGSNEFAEAGCLVGYGVNTLEQYRRAAYFVDRILKGTKPEDLPIEQATKFEMVVNMKTAKALGLTIPNTVLVQTTKIIE
jgi:putative ABC transport system substrate-binding protein